MVCFDLKERFKNSEYRLTKPRKIILDILEKNRGHLSAEDIYREAYRIYPAIGLTTVYRTLEILEKMRLVLKFDFGDGRARYELRDIEGLEEEHHHHLICRGCHKVIDYNDFLDEEIELVKKAISALEKKYNFHITDHIIEFYGYCNECYKRFVINGKDNKGV